MSPSVSVVVPVLDPGPALRAALAAVVAQSFRDWELLVVDDGSAEDLSWVEAVDPRVRLVRRAHAGVSAARNAGIHEARGQWVAFCDHDDVWHPAKLERQVARLRSGHAMASHTAFTWEICDGERTTAHDRRYPVPLTYEALLRGDHVCTSSVVVERVTLLMAGGFDTRLHRAEDLDLWLRLLHDGARFDVVDEPLVTYRSHPAGASADYADTYRRRRQVLRAHLRSAQAAGDTAVVEAALAGLGRGRELAAAQAFDAARATAGVARVPHLARAVAWQPQRVVRPVLSSVVRRVVAAR